MILLAALGGLYGYRPDASDVRLVAVEEDRLLQENEWFEATSASRKLRLETSESWLGEFTLDPGSRLQARQIRDDLAQLYLQSGRMEAFVYLDAKPRFVQTATPATNCVDLGCEYTLTVEDNGDSVVEVTMGRVAFEDGGREVYVPHDATCRQRHEGPASGAPLRPGNRQRAALRPVASARDAVRQVLSP